MEIRQLRHFIAAAESGNLRRASEKIHISPAALSLSIKNLEENLGTVLLHKNRRGVQMTYAGEQFLKSAHSLLRQIDDISAKIKSTEETPIGNVRLGVPVSVNNALAAPLCQILLDRYPGIDLQIEEGSTTSLERLYDENLLDLMISYDVPEKMDQKREELYTESLYLIGEYDANLEGSMEIDSHELNGCHIACSPGTFSMRRAIERYAEKHQISLEFVLDFQSARASVKIAQAGLANAISPWDLVHDHVLGKLVSARKIVNPPIQRTVYLVSSLRAAPSFATSAIIEAIKSAIEIATLQDKIRPEAKHADS